MTETPADASGARPENPSEPETVTEALAFLDGLGYTIEFEIDGAGLALRDSAQLHALTTATVDYRFRFEGDSDPGDESIVLEPTPLTWPVGIAGEFRGVVVSAYGPAADPDHVTVLQALSRPPAS